MVTLGLQIGLAISLRGLPTSQGKVICYGNSTPGLNSPNCGKRFSPPSSFWGQDVPLVHAHPALNQRPLDCFHTTHPTSGVPLLPLTSHSSLYGGRLRENRSLCWGGASPSPQLFSTPRWFLRWTDETFSFSISLIPGP